MRQSGAKTRGEAENAGKVVLVITAGRGYGQWGEEALHRGGGGFQWREIGGIFVTVAVGEQRDGGNVNRGKRPCEGGRCFAEEGKRRTRGKRRRKGGVEMPISIGDHRRKVGKLLHVPKNGGSEVCLGGIDPTSSAAMTPTAF